MNPHSGRRTTATAASTPHLLRLSDDLIFGIFFSGYLGYSWNTLMPIALVNKHFFQIAVDVS